ncbi:MAG TPA: SAM-dependent methyltransferase [Polyangiaceae bacterium]|jgi:methyltransferase (TIGR00027 family)
MLTVSDTAYLVATARADESDRPAPDRLFHDPYAAIFRAAGQHAAEATARMLALPLLRDAIRLRTCFIDDFVRDGLSAGVTQLVLFGAGFDARGLRMPEIRAHGARVYEVDFAAQLQHKRALLEAAGVPLPANIAYATCDFMAPDFGPALAASLDAVGFHRGAGALFVWEGVTGYIDDPAMERSLSFMAGAGGSGTRVVFDYTEQRSAAAAELTRRTGFTTFEEARFDVVWGRYEKAPPPPMFEMFRMGTAAV